MKNNYCEIQDGCKLLIQASNQYEAVVKQNQSLQTELRFANDCNKKDEAYIRQLEESNMILQEKSEQNQKDIKNLIQEKDALNKLVSKYVNALKLIRDKKHFNSADSFAKQVLPEYEDIGNDK